MQSLAVPLHDSCGFARLRSSAMPRKTADAPIAPPGLGRHLLDVVVPRYFKDLNALHVQTNIAYSTIHKWKTGETNPQWKQVEQVAKIAGREPLELLTRAIEGLTSMRNHPDWNAAVEAAKVKYRNRLPDSAYELAASTHAAQWPEHLDAFDVYDLAEFWYRTGSDRALIDAERVTVLAEMAAIDDASKRPKGGR